MKKLFEESDAAAIHFYLPTLRMCMLRGREVCCAVRLNPRTRIFNDQAKLSAGHVLSSEIYRFSHRFERLGHAYSHINVDSFVNGHNSNQLSPWTQYGRCSAITPTNDEPLEIPCTDYRSNVSVVQFGGVYGLHFNCHVQRSGRTYDAPPAPIK